LKSNLNLLVLRKISFWEISLYDSVSKGIIPDVFSTEQTNQVSVGIEAGRQIDS